MPESSGSGTGLVTTRSALLDVVREPPTQRLSSPASGRSPSGRSERPLVTLHPPTKTSLDGGGERREIDPEAARNPMQVLEADVAEPTFDPRNVRHVQSGPVGEVLL